ncbi:thiol-disulfide oxidoreductase DCC family protein [Pseudonocardia acaciae]|uniref:thiol-disulfide oxidoreductase DCC family protein n=1 Tax=Pseudonocardia acaciae TaxID=551276 RepID=UPI00055F37DA|nr:DCC1-like thiol-disulfide oxidoreductase family protein [Pseudonocardia acaciae]
MTPLLVFDGECGFCTRTLGWLRLADRHRVIETAPYQRPGVPELVGASREQCAAAVQWRDADGTRAEGAAAISAALSVALDSTWPQRLYQRTSRAQGKLYGWVSENRHRLPGVTPWCTRYPHDCGA